MSLLLEALKKAEKAKEEALRRAKGGDAPAAEPQLQLEQPPANEKPVLTRAELPDIRQPLEILELTDKYDVRATVAGGGHAAQAEALRHGIARALTTEDPERRRSLKRAGYLTRDDRKKERKKYGQAGARKRFQYSKR